MLILPYTVNPLWITYSTYYNVNAIVNIVIIVYN